MRYLSPISLALIVHVLLSKEQALAKSASAWLLRCCLGFQVLPDFCCDDDPTVFHLYEFLATVVIILLTVSLFGFLHYSARKFVQSGFMLRFKSVLFVGVLTMFIPVFGMTIGASGSEPLWGFCLAGIIGGGVWSVPFIIADSKPT